MTKRSPGLDVAVAAAKAVGHRARLRLVAMLATGELCVCQMTAVLELAPSTVSQHLSVLARGGLVRERKEGKLVFYGLRDEGPAEGLVSTLLALVEGDATTRADRAVVTRLRRIPIATLCAADLDLVAIGVRKPAPATEAPAPAG